MKKTKHPPRPITLLLAVMAKLGGITVKERFIPGDSVGEIVYGMQYGNVIEINPVPAIVEVVIHECLHAVKPEWSEKTIRQQTTRIFHRLTEAEMQKIYEIYKARL